MGEGLSRNLLFLHAFSGCDTTSRIYNMGKPGIIQLFLKHEAVRTSADIFSTCSQNKEDVICAGETTMKLLYGGSDRKGDYSLNDLRRRLFELKKATSTSYVQSKHLPPTSSAAAQHSLRVLHQVWTWIHICPDDSTLKPEDWGWKEKNGMLVPIYSTQQAAPELLKC